MEVSGRFLETRIRVLVSQKLIGAGYRIIQPLQTADRVILIDRGFVKIDQTEDLRNDQATVLGNLHWPDEVDEYTPEPDLTRDIWFARDVPALAKALNADPILVIAREITPAVKKFHRSLFPAVVFPTIICNMQLHGFRLPLFGQG